MEISCCNSSGLFRLKVHVRYGAAITLVNPKATEISSDRMASRDAFEKVIRSEMDVLYRVALRFCGNPVVAEDLVSQTLVGAARGWKRFDGAHPRSWLIKILRNEYLGWLKEQRRQPLSFEALEETVEVADGSHTRPIESLDVLKAVDRLEEPDRSIVIMSDVEQMSSEEVGEALGMRAGAVRLRLFRARHLLRRRLVGWEAEG